MKAKYLPAIVILFLFSCSQKPGDLVPPAIDQSISAANVTVTPPVGIIPADNYTTGTILVAITSPAVPPGTNISFTSDNGTFTKLVPIAISSLAGTNNSAYAYIKCNKAGAVNVTVSVNNSFPKTTQVNFATALPDTIILSPDVASLSIHGTSLANLDRNARHAKPNTPGTPTQGQVVTYSDSTATAGQSIGIFTNFTLSNANSIATAQYMLQDSTYTGFVYLKATIKSGNKAATGTTRLLIK